MARSASSNQAEVLMRIGLISVLLLFFPSAGCAERQEATEVARHFIVVRGTLIPAEGDGPVQILLESSWIEAGSADTIAALAKAERIPESVTPAWLVGELDPEACFAGASTLIVAPSVVTHDGEEARVEIAEEEGDPQLRSLSVTPTVEDERLRLELSYQRFRGGEPLHTIPTTALLAAPGQTIIVEALP